MMTVILITTTIIVITIVITTACTQLHTVVITYDRDCDRNYKTSTIVIFVITTYDKAVITHNLRSIFSVV